MPKSNIDEKLFEASDSKDKSMKFSHGVGNINIKNIWDIHHIKKLTDDLFDSQMSSVTSHIPSSIFFENQLQKGQQSIQKGKESINNFNKQNLGQASKSTSIFKANKKIHKGY